MASTYSTNLAIELIGTGEQSGTWGTTTNTNLGTLLEQAISGYVTQAITDGSGANTTITIPNGATGVARNMVIEMTGALTFSTTSLIVPANKKLYFIFNNTSGGFAVTVKVSGQTGILVPTGKKVILTCNGTDIVEAHTAIVGNATMGGTLGITGTTTAAAINASGTVAMAGAATVGTTLGVTGATTLSSTLGVTGVATLGNGAILGTPASGTVTNLTGTASININGTVGATTPTTGAFTSGTFSTTLGVTGASTLGGNVGIGGATVANALDVSGSIRVQGGNRSLKFNNASVEINIAQVAGGSAALDFNSCALTNVGTIASGALTVTGTLGVTGITTVAAGSAALPAIVSTTGTADTGLWFPAADTLAVSTSGAECMRITSDGRIRFISSSSYTGQQDARIQWVNENSAGVMGQISCVREASPAAPGALAFYTSPDVDVYTYSPLERMRISSAGIVTMSVYGAGAATFSAAGVISSVSDETWKTKDGIPTDPDAMLQKLAPGYWYYNDEKKETFGADRQLGFYAQNVNAAIGPEAAPEPEEGKPWGYYDRSVLAVTVMSLQKALLAIEQLTAKVTALEAK